MTVASSWSAEPHGSLSSRLAEGVDVVAAGAALSSLPALSWLKSVLESQSSPSGVLRSTFTVSPSEVAVRSAALTWSVEPGILRVTR